MTMNSNLTSGWNEELRMSIYFYKGLGRTPIFRFYTGHYSGEWGFAGRIPYTKTTIVLVIKEGKDD